MLDKISTLISGLGATIEVASWVVIDATKGEQLSVAADVRAAIAHLNYAREKLQSARANMRGVINQKKDD